MEERSFATMSKGTPSSTGLWKITTELG